MTGWDLFAKFANPIVADGKVFVPTYRDTELLRQYGGGGRPNQFPDKYYVAVYGLLNAPMPPASIVNHDRDDVVLIRAAATPTTIDKSKCAPVDGTSLDCKDAIAQAAGAPAFHRVIVNADINASACALPRVVTASKNTGLANSTGIGFYSAAETAGNLAAENPGILVPRARMKEAGSAVLLNGAPPSLHEFVGFTNYTTPGNEAACRVLKPYMQFEGAADGKVYRNWDVAENYRITPAITQFDRSGDVLKQ